ncbi:hypothetical protein K461DRAFT_282044 [Myriangium duriaei CBS 260.36]|uniref:Uncharacterized protein n=1 Tax=Myriangium duriaei CBS 260.36 TaxID=1168546 RepID=A0A9P4IW91_9PEZI|nr:hypothetical protein K461DRAFT_282044 [Myriangium duriaei CBS 260.36]
MPPTTTTSTASLSSSSSSSSSTTSTLKPSVPTTKLPCWCGDDCQCCCIPIPCVVM